MSIDSLHLAEHDRLEQHLSAFTLAVDEQRWELAARLLDAFMVRFEAHLGDEERRLLPGVCGVEEIGVLMRQHRELRALLGALRVGLRSPRRVTRAMVSDFEFSWSLHDEYEREALSAWRGLRAAA